MNQRKLGTRARARRKPEVEIVGNDIILRGASARLVEAACRQESVRPEELLTEMLRVIVDRFAIEKPNKLEDLDWQAYAAHLIKRLRKRENKAHAAQKRNSRR